MFSQNQYLAQYLFIIANFLFIFIFNYRIDDPFVFLCITSGVVLFSFFIKRAINQFIGV